MKTQQLPKIMMDIYLNENECQVTYRYDNIRTLQTWCLQNNNYQNRL